jgi:chitin disaccharide deacetylase
MAIIRAHHRGVVTDVSVLAVAPKVDRSVRLLERAPRLGVGAHLAAVGEDPPLLTAAEIPTLVDERGRFPPTWRAFALGASAGRLDPGDLAREWGAQIERLTGAGLVLSHLDSHQHVHLMPVAGRALIRLAREHGVPAVRLPTSHAAGPKAAMIRRLSRRLQNVATSAGVGTTDLFAGLDEAGSLTFPVLARTLRWVAARPGQSCELNCHPGAPGDRALSNYPWGYKWKEEYDALTNIALPDLIRELGLRLLSYADLFPSSGPSGAPSRGDRSAGGLRLPP